MSDPLLVYATFANAASARSLLGAACQATGLSARLEVYGSGSLYQRLGPRHAPPLPDLVVWSGPFAAQAAASAGLLQAYTPPRLADGALHHLAWLWTTLTYRLFRASGSPSPSSLVDLGRVPRLAVADPERSESGTMLLLAALDRARQVEGDAERAWAWWQQRAQAGLLLCEDEAAARAAVEPGGGASHALALADGGPALLGLAPVPDVVSLAASARNLDAARRLLDWLTGEQAAARLPLSPWQAPANGVQAALGAAPLLDVAWATQQYTAARRRWAASGFGPTLGT